MLISRNLVLTCAHNFWYKGKEIGKDSVEVYPGASGILDKQYRV